MIDLSLLTRPEALVAQVLPDGVPIVRDLVQQRIERVFGDVPFATTDDRGDAGLFGPGSASWQVLGDPAAIIGGVRGLMLQTLHPGSMAGVHDHSAFAGDPLLRLQRTTAWVVASAFGSVPDVLRAAARVRATHPRIHGVTPGGERYDAQDPHLLAWVQCTLTASFLATDAAYAAVPVTGERRDEFVREQSLVACLLDPRVELESLAPEDLRSGTAALPMLDDGVLPRTYEDLATILTGFEWELEVNHQARAALGYLKSPPLPPMLRAAYAVVHMAAVATLPRRQRDRLGMALPIPQAMAVAAGRMHVGALRAATGKSQSVVAATARALG